MIAVRLNMLTRKTLGVLHTNLDGSGTGREGLRADFSLYAAGEIAGYLVANITAITRSKHLSWLLYLL